MKTRTMITIKSLLLLAGLNATSCKKSMITTKACSLNYQEALANHQEQVASGEASEEDAPRECEYPEAEPGANLGVNLVMRNFTDEQEAKMIDAVERIKIVINSVDFKDRVIGHTYNGERVFVDNNGLTNEEIYEKIMEGAEDLIPEVDQEMDVDVTMYYKRSSTVGYTYPDTTRTWVNSRFFMGYTTGQVAANVTHEWTHKIGFGHSFYNNPSRPYSVPYAVGSIIEELVDSM
jgi:hypothetical protein